MVRKRKIFVLVTTNVDVIDSIIFAFPTMHWLTINKCQMLSTSTNIEVINQITKVKYFITTRNESYPK